MVKVTKRAGSVALRGAAVCATLAAVIIMVTSHQRASFLALSFEAKYTQMPAFKYFVIGNAVVSVYSLLVLFLPEESLLWKLAVVMDMVCSILLASSISAAVAVAEVGKRGNVYAGWLPICGQVSKFCGQITAALIAGFIALILYIFLLLFSLHNVLDPFLLHKS